MAPHAEAVTIPSGSPVDTGGASFVLGGDEVWHDASPGLGFTGWGPVAFSFVVSTPDWGPVTGAMTAPAGAASQASAPMQSPAIAGPGMGVGSPAVSPGGWVAGTGGAAGVASPSASSVTPGNSGVTANPPPGHYDPGAGVLLGRDQTPAPTAFLTNAPPPIAFPLPMARTDAIEVGALLAAPLSATTGVIGPGAPFATTVGANPGSMAVVGPSTQAAPATSAPPVQSSVRSAPDGSSGEHVSAFSVGPMQRVLGRRTIDPGRLTRTLGRSIPVSTVSHPVTSTTSDPSSADDAGPEGPMPSPRGADLIAETLPPIGDSLERSLDEFARQLQEVEVGGLGAVPPMPIVVTSAAALTAATAAVVMREIARRRSARGRGLCALDSLGREFALSFPELPRSWSEKR
jgi:hypothetical protein